jgi:DNA-binding CsgD family transcriptional regulator
VGSGVRPPDDAITDPAVYQLIRQLVARLTDGRPVRLPASGEVNQLLDVEVDGVWCRFARIAPAAATAAALSPREREIARMVAKGHTNQAIADVLGISVWTVSTHLRRAFAKLGVNSRAAMVAGVLDTGRGRVDEPSDPPAESHLRVTPVRATHVSASPEGATHVRGSQEDVTTRLAADSVAWR